MFHSISFFTRRIGVSACTIALFALFGCSGDDTPTDGGTPNRDPVLTFTVTARAVPRSEALSPRTVTLTVNATDPDQDPVTVNWAVTRNGQPSGVLNPAQQGLPAIQWQTPVATGRDTIRVTASDGKGGTATLTETIQVGTLKEGRIQGSVTWSAADSPFIVNPVEDNFVISDGSTLTVPAGSELLLDGSSFAINVGGTLQTQGTAVAPVVIRPNQRISAPGDWKGIEAVPGFTNPPILRLNHTQIQYAKEAIRVVGATDLYLDGCRITRSSEAAISCGSSGVIDVRNTNISSNELSGIRIIKITTDFPTVVITGCTITSNGDLSGETFYLDQAGIYISIPDPAGSASITITDCDINFNGVPGVHLANACYPVFRNNGIYANELGKTGTRYNFKLEDGFGGASATLDATMNYWGFLTETEIKALIRDSDDNGSIGVRVVVDPWLTTAP